MKAALSVVFDKQNGYIRRHHTYHVSDGGSIEELRALTQFARDVLRACDDGQEVHVVSVDHKDAPKHKPSWGRLDSIEDRPNRLGVKREPSEIWPLKDYA